jgi:hypothetical protein
MQTHMGGCDDKLTISGGGAAGTLTKPVIEKSAGRAYSLTATADWQGAEVVVAGQVRLRAALAGISVLVGRCWDRYHQRVSVSACGTLPWRVLPVS